jgi:stearoyl-CoA desaturase (delta-9 desaturase)
MIISLSRLLPNKYRIRLLQLFVLITACIGLLYFGISGLLFSIPIYMFMNVFCGNATLHRYYGHRSFEMANWKKQILTALTHTMTVGSVLGWSGHHRWHHKHSDTEHDIHSPTVNGIRHILFGVWDVNIPRSMVKDLLKDRSLVRWHKNYFRWHLFIITTLVIISPWALVHIYAIPNLLTLLSGYVIAIVPHLSGDVKNSVITEIFTLGEGGHKNHHDDSRNYRFSKYDLTALAIEKVLKE